MSSLDRRSFLRTGIVGSLLLAPALRGAAYTKGPLQRDSEPGAARNVIFLVSDGMSMGTLTMAERYSSEHLGRSTNWIKLYGRPDLNRALVDTRSASSLVTDSAAASSAWGSGHKVVNGNINMTPDGKPQMPILRLAGAAGKSTGLVTTATITHATPAGFAAQVSMRAEESAIADQYLEVGVDLLLGGGLKFFEAKKRKDQRDLLGDFKRSGYHVVRDRDALMQCPNSGKLLGLFHDSHLPYSLDHRADATLTASVPTIAEMVRVALSRLSMNEKGFVLQIEGARVDHAAHANDVGALIFDQLAFDEAVAVAVEFASGRDDTLVILTTDHSTANPGLLGTGGSFESAKGSYYDSNRCFAQITKFRQTNVWALSGLTAEASLEQVRDRVKMSTDLILDPEHAELLRRALRKEHREGYRVRNAPLLAMGQVLSNYVSVGWAGEAHTTDYAELVAFGPGSRLVHGLMQNTDLFSVMTRALGIKSAASTS